DRPIGFGKWKFQIFLGKPLHFFNTLLFLWLKLPFVLTRHLKPVRFLEHKGIFIKVNMIGAGQFLNYLQFVKTALLSNLSQGTISYLLSILAFAFWQVP